jgi:hypothetical protein
MLAKYDRESGFVTLVTASSLQSYVSCSTVTRNAVDTHKVPCSSRLSCKTRRWRSFKRGVGDYAFKVCGGEAVWPHGQFAVLAEDSVSVIATND